MKGALLLAYVVMAGWLVLAAARRIAITLMAGASVDPVTVISGALGGIALLLLLPAIDEWSNRHDR